MKKEVMILTGAGQIGMAIARRMGYGKKIVVGNLNPESSEAVCRILNEAGFDAVPVEMNLSSRESILNLIAVARKHGEISMLVNTAGVSPSQASIETILKVDLYGTAVLLEEVAGKNHANCPPLPHSNCPFVSVELPPLLHSNCPPKIKIECSLRIVRVLVFCLKISKTSLWAIKKSPCKNCVKYYVSTLRVKERKPSAALWVSPAIRSRSIYKSSIPFIWILRMWWVWKTPVWASCSP